MKKWEHRPKPENNKYVGRLTELYVSKEPIGQSNYGGSKTFLPGREE